MVLFRRCIRSIYLIFGLVDDFSPGLTGEQNALFPGKLTRVLVKQSGRALSQAFTRASSVEIC
jgi:hypothetical protein